MTAAYSSDLGGSGGFTWTDRNLFGNAELLNLSATLINWGGSDTTGLGYDLGAQLNKPDFGRPDQSLQFNLTALKQDLIAYDQTAQLGGVTVLRKLLNGMDRRCRCEPRAGEDIPASRKFL